jgi:hypothetical protein
VKIFTGLNKIGDQGQSQTLAVSTKSVIERVVYQPYVSILDEYSPSGLYMSNVKQSSLVPHVPQHYSSYHSQAVINELRAGDSLLTQAAWLIITIWMLRQSNSNIEAFQPIKPPHHQLHPSSSFQNPHNFKTTSSSGRGTQLEGRKRHRAEMHIDMDDQYRQFMLTKNTNTKCSQQRFEELCCDSKTGKIDLSSIDEALGILEAEGRGLVKNASRPEKNVIDADFEIEGPGRYDLADLKTPINWGKGNQNLDQAAKHLAEKILNQRLRIQGYGKNPLHIVNLIKLDPNERMDYKQNVINAIGSSKDLVFINEEVKI